MSWQPDVQVLGQLVECLKNAAVPDTVVQQQVERHLTNLRETHADFVNYLAFILIEVKDSDAFVKSLAGITLKNCLSVAPDLTYVKSVILALLSEPNRHLSNVFTTAISSLLRREAFIHWDAGLSYLVSSLAVSAPVDECIRLNSLKTILKLSQDCPMDIQNLSINKVYVLDLIAEKIFENLETGAISLEGKELSLEIMATYIDVSQNAFMRQLDRVRTILFHIAGERNGTHVQQLVCRTFVCIVSARPDVLKPYIGDVINFMIYNMKEYQAQTSSDDEAVALEACEFWIAVAEDPELVEILNPFLDRLIPLLLSCMVYNEEDILAFDTEDDAHVPDRESDIAPVFNTSGTKGQGGDEEGEERGGGDTSWNLRKCSAAALDVFALTFGTDILAFLLPPLKERLFSDDWVVTESSVLALGAVAEGCLRGMVTHLPAIFELLIGFLSHPKPLVRSITCWTLSRYATWLSNDPRVFHATLEHMLRMSLDNNKRVQEAACSAVATLEEESGKLIVPYANLIIETFVAACAKYQRKNRLILYDAIGTLADIVGAELNAAPALPSLLAALFVHWDALADDDDTLIALFECFSGLAIGLRAGFAPYAPHVFSRAVRISAEILVAFQETGEVDETNSTRLVVCLDLLSALTQALEDGMAPFFESGDPPVLGILHRALQVPAPAVKQSGFALLGDVAICLWPLLAPHLDEFLSFVLESIVTEPDEMNTSVCNNAIWAVGEMALRSPAEGAEATAPPASSLFLNPQYIDVLSTKLISILLSKSATRSLIENSAVTLGRLALVSPAVIAEKQPVFVAKWADIMAVIHENDERDSAFCGMAAAIARQPMAVAANLTPLLIAIAHTKTPSPELRRRLEHLLTSFKAYDESSFAAAVGGLHETVREQLARNYAL